MKFSHQDIEQQLITTTQQLLTESGTHFGQRKITLDVSLQRHLGIDSLGRAELFQRIEKHFDVCLTDNVLAEAETLEDIAHAIYQYTPTQRKIQRTEQPTPHKQIKVDPSQTQSLTEMLQLYANQAYDLPHIYMQNEKGSDEVITYGKLYESAQIVAHSLVQQGLRPGDTVAIMLPTCPGFYYTFFGVLFAGCIPVPIYPPLRPQQIEAYAKHEAKILRDAQVRMLVTFHEAENLSQLLKAFIPSLKAVVTTETLLKHSHKGEIYPARGDDYGLIQYTSGSTSAPKGVLVTHQNLLSNIRAFGETIQVTQNDAVVSWLPLYHDLGLIGFWLGSLYHGVPLNSMSPLTFLNRPEQWLWAMHYHRGTISGAPNFAYELCIRKVDPASIEGLDLSSWRIAANGAEAIQPKTLQRFTEKFAPYGFRAETFLPVYGLAESTVGLAVSPLNRKPWIDRIDRKAFEEKRQALPTNQEGLEFVACGPAIPGHHIRIVNNDNQVLPERHIGHLQFKGPSNMQGYYGNPEATQAIYHEGWLDSGDMAYQVNGEVFITGRYKDTIIKAGRNLYPTEIEELAAKVGGIRKGCVIAFGMVDAKRGTEKLIVVAETQEKDSKRKADIIDAITDTVNNALDIAPDEVVLVVPRIIPKTSSGKLQRAACKRMYSEGLLSKRTLPIWMQVSKIGATSASIRIKNSLGKTAKFLYTSYIALLVGLTLPFVMLSLYTFKRDTAAKICKLWARFLFLLGFCRITVEGKENISAEKAIIYAPNHASYIDSLVMLALMPTQTLLVGKGEIRNTPILRTFMEKLGYLSVDRLELVKGIEDSKILENTLIQGKSIVIFPEGTFTYAAGLRPFKSGAFKVAVETQTPVCPVAIQGTRNILRGEERLLQPRRIRVVFNSVIKPRAEDWQEVNRLKSAVREVIAKHCGEPTLDMIPAGPLDTIDN